MIYNMAKGLYKFFKIWIIIFWMRNKRIPSSEILNVSLEILYLIEGIVSPALIEPKTVKIFVFDAGVMKVFMLIPLTFLFLFSSLTAIETIEFFKFSFLETHLSIFLLEI